MIRLRPGRRSLAMAGVVCLAAAALVAVSVRVVAVAEAAPSPVPRKHPEHDRALPMCAGARANSVSQLVVARIV